MRKLRMLSLCAGIGGFDLAAEWTGGIEAVGQVEIDPFCQAVLAKHWPHVKRLGDINEVRGDEFGTIDLVVGGIPCQPFSSAGKRRGKEDHRHLWPQAFAIITTAKPSWVVIENVDDFTYMALDDVSANLESAGYAVQAYVLPACAVGAPHVRERCFVVAHSSGSRLNQRQGAGRAHHELDAPGPGVRLANTYRFGECRQEVSIASGQRGAALSAGVCEWADSASVADADDQRCTECESATISGDQGRDGRRVSTRRPSGAAQSRMGGDPHGFPAWLDRHRWPALPGQEQHAWEPPRTIATRTSHHSKRLKGLGNSLVPQHVYPILQGIVDYEEARQ